MNLRLVSIALALTLLVAFFAYKAITGFTTLKPGKELPIYGPVAYDTAANPNTPIPEEAYHHVPAFSFTNQDGATFTSNEVASKIYVVDYFFTTCRSICPIMSTKMETVASTFKADPDFKILSLTVDPEEDKPKVLKAYAREHHADPKQWQFLTGDKKKLYQLAREGFYLTATEGDGGEEDFIHTQNFALVDKQGKIRGYYDGTDSMEVQQLITDVKLLQQYYKFKGNKTDKTALDATRQQPPACEMLSCRTAPGPIPSPFYLELRPQQCCQ